MKIGLGHMRMPPDVFWQMTLVEWFYALEGYGEKQEALRSMWGVETAVEPMTSDSLSVLMEKFPDDRHRS